MLLSLIVMSVPALPSSTSSTLLSPSWGEHLHWRSDGVSGSEQHGANTKFSAEVASPVGESNLSTLSPVSSPNQVDTPLLVLNASSYAEAKKQVGSSTSKQFRNHLYPQAEVAQIVNTISGFEGIHYGSNGPYNNYVVPPDVQVAAGQNYIMEMVNVLGAVWTKQGTSVKIFSLSSFFNTGSDHIGDPKLLFDIGSGRWFASVLDVNTSSVKVAVSTTNDPTGNWYFYNFVAAAGNCPDQPIIGVSDDKFAISANDYTSPCARTSNFVGVQYWILNKSEMLLGSAVNYVVHGPDTTLFSVHPVHSLSATTTQFMVSVGSESQSILQLFSVTGVPPASVNVQVYNLPISPTKAPPNATQPATNSTVDTGDARVQDAIWNKGKLWLSFNDGCVPLGDLLLRSCFRLIEIDTSSNSVKQDFDVGAVGEYYFYPALRIDNQGNLAVIFGYSSSTTYPGLMVTGQSIGDLSGTWEQPRILKQGLGPETRGRYGDYFGASLDPSDPSQIWVAGEYGSTAGWATFIASVSITVNTVALTLSYSVQGGGSGYSAPTFTYVSDRIQRTATLTPSPTTYYVDSGSRWSVPVQLVGTSSSERWQTNQSTSGTATSSQTMDFLFYHQFYIQFNYHVVGGGAGYSPPIITYSQFAALTSVPANTTVWADSGGAWSITDSLPGSSSRGRWQTNQQTQGTATSPATINFLYYHQYITMFNYDVMGGGEGYSSPTIKYTRYGAQTSTVGGSAVWVDAGSMYFYPNPLDGSTPKERWFSSSSTGTISSASTVAPVYYHQYLIRASYSTVGAGTPPGPILSSTTLGVVLTQGLAATPQEVWVDSGAPYSITNPLLGSTSSERWQSTSPSIGVVSLPSNLALTYYHQYSLTLSYSVSGGGAPQAPALSGTQFGRSNTIVLTTTPMAYWLDEGSNRVIDNPLGGSTTTERWQSNQPTSATVSSSVTSVFNYHHQYHLFIDSEPSEGGSVSPSSDWYDAGASVQLSVSVNSGWEFEGWKGSGDGSYSGQSSSISIIMKSPITQSVIFYPRLIISATTLGSVSYAFDSHSGTIPEGASKTVFVPPGANVSLTATPSFFFYAFAGWTGTVPQSASRISVIVNSPMSMHANYSYNYVNIGLIIGVILGVVATSYLVIRRRSV